MNVVAEVVTPGVQRHPFTRGPFSFPIRSLIFEHSESMVFDVIPSLDERRQRLRAEYRRDAYFLTSIQCLDLSIAKGK